jgi:AAA domain-containing protein
MSFTFRPAARDSVWLLLGLSGASGSGKSYTAMRLATGLSGDKPFAVIDTEAGRAKHYADRFKFDHGDLTSPFTPERYLEAILAAEKAGYGIIVVDSMSHEWAGDGGILDMQEDELDRMAGQDFQRREACKMAAWIKPKMAHKKMMARLLQLRAHLILCFRSEPKIEMVKKDGKLVIQPKQTLTGLDGWVPICEKNLPYELTASFLLTADKPGVPKPIKLQEQHKLFFPLDQPITENSGIALAAWARGSELSIVCDEEDFKDIGTATQDAGLKSRAVAERIVQMGFAQPKDLTKARKGELLNWIESQKQPVEVNKK